MLDSTGLELFGQGEWDANDAAQVPALLGQTEGVITSVTADGAYNGEPTYAAAAARQRHPPADVIVPPRASAVPKFERQRQQHPGPTRPPHPAHG